MRINPVYIPIGQIFKRFVYQVPRFQRGYSWDTPQIEDFLSDVGKCFEARRAKKPQEHFLGGVVGVDERISGSVEHMCDLIDGQQRITTFVLFARVLELKLRALAESLTAKPKANAEQWADLLRTQYMVQSVEVNRVFSEMDRLTLSEPDKVFFNTLLHELPDTLDGKRESHHRLKRAVEATSTMIDKILKGLATDKQKVEALADLGDVLRDDLTIILLPTEDRSDAYRLFQVLNDRGTSLSEGDLLRAIT